LLAIDISTASRIHFGNPHTVTNAPQDTGWLDAAADGRLAMIVGVGDVVAPITLVIGWERTLEN